MRRQLFSALLLLFLLNACRSSKSALDNKAAETLSIAFGSCSDEDKPQILWDDVLSEEPDLWVWLGDNVYGDTEDMSILKTKYDQQKANADYQKLMASTEIIGTWDDHDYGANNAGKDYPKREESQQLLLDFLDVPDNDRRRTQEGIYTSKEVTKNGISIKILLLDTRYFRDSVAVVDGISQPNETGTLLGKVQWDWLEDELKSSKADVHLFASGIQVIPEEHRFEKWANFPNELEKLFKLISAQNTKMPIMLSGDRHIGEISKQTYNGKVIYDITSSSLTHGWSERRKEPNKHRLGQLVYDQNYGLLNITKQNNAIKIETLLKGDDGKILEKKMIDFSAE